MTVYISHDTVEAELDIGDTEVDTSGDEVDLSLDEERIVTVNNAPWQEGFESDKFLAADAVVARPIEQKYVYDGDVVTYKKPRKELKKAAWSLDNAPFTLGHPSSGSVRSVDQIDGFWREPEYDEDSDELRSKLYIPIGNDEAFEHVDENGDVSVGFSHRISDASEEDVDGYQTDIYFDHVASVETGRCSGEDGCGIEVNQMDDVGEYVGNSTEDSYEITPSYGTSTNVDDGTIGIYVESESTVSEGDSDDSSVTYVTGDYKDSDGNYFAISPKEGYGDAKYPIANCSDVQDAWKLRGHGDYRPNQDTLEERIKRRANDLDCDSTPWEESTEDSGNTSDNMTEETCDCEGDGGTDISFDVSSMSVDAVADKHDGVQEVLDEKEELEEQIDELQNEVEESEDEVEDLREELDEYRQDERDGLVEAITDITDTWDEENLREMDVEGLRDRLELAKDVSEETATANPDKGVTQDASPNMGSERVDPKGLFE